MFQYWGRKTSGVACWKSLQASSVQMLSESLVFVAVTCFPFSSLVFYSFSIFGVSIFILLFFSCIVAVYIYFFYYLSCHWCLYFFLFVFLFCFLSYRWKGCVGQLIPFYFYFKGEQLANGFFFFRSIATHHPVHRLIRWRRVKASRLTSLRLRFENWTK